MAPVRGRIVEGRMDAVVNQLARELAEAIRAATADDARVEACREKARDAGFDMRVSLEAVIGFVSRTPGAAPVKAPPARRVATTRLPLDIPANDRPFLKSLRISADETTGKEAACPLQRDVCLATASPPLRA